MSYSSPYKWIILTDSLTPVASVSPAGPHRKPLAGQLHEADREPGPHVRQGVHPDPEPDLADPQETRGSQVGRYRPHRVFSLDPPTVRVGYSWFVTLSPLWCDIHGLQRLQTTVLGMAALCFGARNEGKYEWPCGHDNRRLRNCKSRPIDKNTNLRNEKNLTDAWGNFLWQPTGDLSNFSTLT